MRRFLILTTIGVFVTVILSSCAVNVFRSLDTPKSTLELSQTALSALNGGDTQGAMTMAANAFGNMSDGSFDSTGFYGAVVTSDTSTQSRTKLSELSNFLETTKSTDVALKYASEALMNSIAKTMNINVLSITKQLLSNVQPSSAKISASPVASSDVVGALELLLGTAHNLQMMRLLQDLAATIYRLDPTNSSALLSMGFYAFLQIPTILFDSNGNDVLDPQDEIYTYLWDSSTNSFKTSVSQVDYDHIMNDVVLGTYGNSNKSQYVLNQVSVTVTALDRAMSLMDPNQTNDLLNTLRRYVGQLELAMYVIDANALSGIRTLGSLMGQI